MSLDPRTLVHRWFNEVWNEGREETIDELLAKNGIGHGLGESGAEMHGPEAFKVLWRNLRGAFPDCHIEINDTITHGDKAVVRVTLSGTHKGEGGFGVLPTGRRVTVSGIIVIRVENGQMHEAWNSWDQLGLLQQIGAIPAPPDRFLTSEA